VVALIATSCDVRIYPLRGPTGSDAATGIDAAIGIDAPIGSDAPISSECPSQLVGFATMSDLGGEWDGGIDASPTLLLDGGVTGGGVPDAGMRIALDAGMPMLIDAQYSDALTQLILLAGDKTPGPLIIVIKGMISIPPTPDGGDTGGEQIRVSSNKTVLGADANSGLFGGGLGMTKVSNVIVRNLTIAKPNTDGAIDAIHIEKSHQIWIDHCDLSSTGGTGTYDGLVDISDHSDFVTVSWTHYHDHKDSGLVGRSDSSAAAAEDAGTEHVTYDHDWFENLTTGPRIRVGTVHVLNGFFQQVTNYGVASTDGATVLIEASAFQHVTPPGQTDPDFGPVTTILDSPATAGYVDYRTTNLTDSTDGKNIIPSTQVVSWTPPYLYANETDSAGSVPTLVAACAGTGKIVPSGI